MSTPVGTSGLQDRGFLASLFDFSFTTFVTLRFLKVIYGIVVVLIGLGALVFFLRLVTLGGVAAVFGLVVVPLVALLYLVFARIYLELIALLFRIAESTARIDQHLASGGSLGTPGGPAAPPPPPGYGGPSPFSPPAQPGYGTPPPTA